MIDVHVRFLKRLVIGYTIIVVMVVGGVVFILSGASDRVMNYVSEIIHDLESSV